MYKSDVQYFLYQSYDNSGLSQGLGYPCVFKGIPLRDQRTSFEQCIRVNMCLEDPLKDILGKYKGYPFKLCIRVAMCSEDP